MATSTALRFRSRAAFDNAILLDSIASDEAIIARSLFDACAVNDAAVSTHRILKSGDRLTILSDSDTSFRTRDSLDSDSVTVLDSLVKRKQQRRILFDFVQPRDDGFITDKDYFRNRVLNDSCTTADGFQKSITREDLTVTDRVIFDSVQVIDDIEASSSGIKRKTLTDAISVIDQHRDSSRKSYFDSVDLSDNMSIVRTFCRMSSDSMVVRDDMIVSRAAILNSAIASDSLTLIDRVTATYVIAALPVSVRIRHGIENM